MTSDKPDVVKNIALYCEQYLNDNNNCSQDYDGLSDEENNVSEYSIATTPSMVSNANRCVVGRCYL